MEPNVILLGFLGIVAALAAFFVFKRKNKTVRQVIEDITIADLIVNKSSEEVEMVVVNLPKEEKEEVKIEVNEEVVMVKRELEEEEKELVKSKEELIPHIDDDKNKDKKDKREHAKEKAEKVIERAKEKALKAAERIKNRLKKAREKHSK